MRKFLWMSLFFIGVFAQGSEQKVQNKSEQEVNKTYEKNAEFRVEDKSSLTGRVVAGGDLKLWINDKSHVHLEGSARRVIVKCCEGESELDLRGFDCEEVVFENALTKNSTVYVCAREKIEFNENIDEKSVAFVRAPLVKGQTIKGHSRVIYSGETPVFKDVDNGGGTENRDW